MRISSNSMDYVTLTSMGHKPLASMDDLWQKKSGSAKNELNNEMFLSANMPMLPKSAQLQPNWDNIPSKSKETMTEEEFEEAIRELAIANTEKGAFGSKEYAKLLTEYISVASPDRKAAYEKFNGVGDSIYGSSNEKLMTRGSNGVWKVETLTKDEVARASQFLAIYANAVKESEAKSSANPYSLGGTTYSGLYNVLA